MKIESFDNAEAYRDNLRPIEPPVYNDARLRELPIPRLSFASESNDDDHDDDDFGLVSLFSDDSESLAEFDDSSTSNNDMEFISFSTQNTSLEEQNESEVMPDCETDQKNPLDDVEIDETQRAALEAIFGGSTQSNIGTTGEMENDTAAEKNPSCTNDDVNNDQSIEMNGNGIIFYKYLK